MNHGDEALFHLEQVNYTYTAANTPSFQALRNLNLKILHGEFVAIVGPSGSGKSTLMHLLGLMSVPTEGTLKLNAQDVSQLSSNQKSELRNKTIGFLFQQFFLLPQLTVLENILLPIEYRPNTLSDSELHNRALQLIERYGLNGQEEKRPANLSGGQRQRVALCRALIMDPQVLMCDEPTGALDTATAQEVLSTLEELHASGRTIIVITHDQEVAQRAQRIVRIVDGQIASDTESKFKNKARLSANAPVKMQQQMRTQSIKSIVHKINHHLRSMFIPTWQALKTQRLRTALTMTGLLLGVSSVFIMLTLTGKVGKIFEDFFATQGSRKAFVSFDGRIAERTGSPRWRGLNIKTELPRLNAQIRTYGRLDPNINSDGCNIISASGNYQGGVTGLSSLLEMRENDLRIAEGRTPLPHEFEPSTPARIALIGSDTALKLFPNGNQNRPSTSSPIGQHIIVRGCDFEGIVKIVGILKPIDSLFDRDVNSSVYIPSQTLIAGGASVYKSRLTAVPNPDISPTWFAKYVIGKLSLMTGNQFPFRYFAAEQELEKFNLMLGILTGLTLVIGTLCTFIGGIGVMNIMLVNVHERVQEIGIRKAVGAKDGQIRSQFLLESTGLCLLSGSLGLMVGIAVSISAFAAAQFFLPKVENLTFQPDSVAILISLGVSISAGVLFGTWPARAAAALDIVDALKQE